MHEKKKRKSVLINFHILHNFIRYTGPMVSRGQQFTGGLALLPLVEMNWGKKSKKKPNVLTNFHYLVYFIRHTGFMVTTGFPNVQTLISSVQTLV